MTPAERLAALPESLRSTLVDLVGAVGRCSQEEKAELLLALLRTSVGSHAAADSVLGALSEVIDELYVLGAPVEQRATLAGEVAERRALAVRLRDDPAVTRVALDLMAAAAGRNA